MEHIYTFVGGTPDFLWLSQRDFRRRFGLKEALGYLQQIRGTLVAEAREHRRAGCFYTGLRHAFAEIDGLGKLYKGEYGTGNTAANAIAFGADYLGRVDARYKDLFGLLFDLYRHGLAHGHLVRTARYCNAKKWHFVHWAMTESKADHLAVKKDRSGRRVLLVVSVPQIVDDTIAAIDHFCQDLTKKGPKSRLFSRFKRGYAGACIALRDAQAPHARTGRNKPTLKLYSKEGIAWIQQNA